MHSENETQVTEIPPPLMRMMLADDALEKARKESRGVESEAMRATLREYFERLALICELAQRELR